MRGYHPIPLSAYSSVGVPHAVLPPAPNKLGRHSQVCRSLTPTLVLIGQGLSTTVDTSTWTLSFRAHLEAYPHLKSVKDTVTVALNVKGNLVVKLHPSDQRSLLPGVEAAAFAWSPLPGNQGSLQRAHTVTRTTALRLRAVPCRTLDGSFRAVSSLQKELQKNRSLAGVTFTYLQYLCDDERKQDPNVTTCTVALTVAVAVMAQWEITCDPLVKSQSERPRFKPRSWHNRTQEARP